MAPRRLLAVRVKGKKIDKAFLDQICNDYHIIEN